MVKKDDPVDATTSKDAMQSYLSALEGRVDELEALYRDLRPVTDRLKPYLEKIVETPNRFS